MTSPSAPASIFHATPVVDNQLIVSSERPEAPASYDLVQIDGAWLAHDRRLRVVALRDRAGRPIGRLVGYPFSAFAGRFLSSGPVDLPVEVADADALEREVLPQFAGSFVLITEGHLPQRLYPDHGGSLSVVYSPSDRRAASSPSLLLDETAYQQRFRADLHEALVLREGLWISGTLTAHAGVSRLLPNHRLDLSDWTVARYWPRPGEFATWRSLPDAAARAADGLKAFVAAACEEFRVAATLTAGSDTRLLLSGFKDQLDRVEFFTLEPADEIDVDISKVIARRFSLPHRALRARESDALQLAIWDRTIGDCLREAPRGVYRTMLDLVERDVVLTGAGGEVGRCRLYRQDFMEINQAVIDPRFVVGRLTLPPHPELVESVSRWFEELAGHPNSVILDLAYLELKFGTWAMGQRPITNSIKLNLLAFMQRPVLDAFIGVAPAEKGRWALFAAIIGRLWPELISVPINKYGDLRDYLVLIKKLGDPGRVRRYLRDRMAKKTIAQPREAA